MSTNITPYQPTSFSELEVFCQRITKSGMVPRQYQGKPDDAFVAIAYGAEVGLPPLAALQHVAVINGRPGLYGDAIAGVALKSGAIKSINEWLDGKPGTDEWSAHCEVIRPDGTKVMRSFSMADAKRAGLAGKPGPWSQFPQRMLAARARGYAVRDAAPHSFLGYTVEEIRDIESVEGHRGPDKARDITPTEPPGDSGPTPHAAVKQALDAAPPPPADDPSDPLRVNGLPARDALSTLQWAVDDADADEAERLWAIYRPRLEGQTKLAAMLAELDNTVAAKKTGPDGKEAA